LIAAGSVRKPAAASRNDGAGDAIRVVLPPAPHRPLAPV